MTHYTYTNDECQKMYEDKGTGPAEGTHLVGHLHEVDYETLLRVFGQPTYFDLDGYKTTAEWVLNIVHPEGGHDIRATIYDWKTGQCPWLTSEWNIGGDSAEPVTLVRRIIMEFRDKRSKME